MATNAELSDLDAATLEFREERLTPAEEDAAGRTGGQRDADRILYSQAFRRLGGVTQVVAVNETQLFHTRLTHSLKVGQIGHRLAQMLRQTSPIDRLEAAGNIDPDVVYAAALAHDLGHPPFGHVVEEELQLVLKSGIREGYEEHSEEDAASQRIDSFEGNAQSFRIVTKLSWRSNDPHQPGLNLTRATLAAILKYPWLRADAPPGKSRKWGAYLSEQEEFAFAVKPPSGTTRLPGWRSPEAHLMDWSDDIAYAVHDVEDFFRAGLIPLDRLYHIEREGRRFLSRITPRLVGKDGLTAVGVEEAFERLKATDLPITPFDGSRTSQVAISRLANTLITRYTDAAVLAADGTVEIEDGARHQVAVLKMLTWFYMIYNPALSTLQAGQRARVRFLYRRLVSWVDSEAGAGSEKITSAQLPSQLVELLKSARTDRGVLDAYRQGGAPDDEAIRRRCVVDYLSSLTESQSDDLYERFTGGSSGSALVSWLRA